MTGIVDYNAGNITSVAHALDYLSRPFIVSKIPHDLESCDSLIFPGVGDAAFAMSELKKTGFDDFLKDWAASGKRILGVCLGSQIIFDFSEEGNTACLGLIKGKIVHLSKLLQNKNEKIPHMGWNNLFRENGETELLKDVDEKSDFYFVHSYAVVPNDEKIVKAYAEYGEAKIPSIIESNNIFACQFHPEKSGEAGLKIIKNFCLNEKAAQRKIVV